MVLRVAFFMLMALALVGFGTVAWVALRQPAPPPAVVARPVAAPSAPLAAAPAPQKKILVTVHAIGTGVMIKPEDVTSKPVSVTESAGAIAADTPDAIRSLAGSMSKHAMGPGEPIREDDVMKPGDHGFMAAALAPGMRAVTIGVDATSGSAGLVWPGDHVDLTLTVTNVNQTPGRSVSAETILTNARVIAIDQQLMQGAAPNGTDGPARTVTLEVTPEAVQRVSVAMRLGRLSLSVRAVSSGGTEPEGVVSGAGSKSIYASDVAPNLGGEAPAVAAPRVVNVYHGSAEPKEFKY